jgi:glutaredoxin
MPVEHVKGKDLGKIKLYALSTCPWCRKTKALLNEMGAEYDFVDVDLETGASRNETMQAVRKWNPAGSFPVLVIGDKKAIVGFRESEIREALKK